MPNLKRVFSKTERRDARLGILLVAFQNKNYELCQNTFRDVMENHNRDTPAMDAANAFVMRLSAPDNFHYNDVFALNVGCYAVQHAPSAHILRHNAFKLVMDRARNIIRKDTFPQPNSEPVGGALRALGELFNYPSLKNSDRPGAGADVHELALLVLTLAPHTRDNHPENTAFALEGALTVLGKDKKQREYGLLLMKDLADTFREKQDFKNAIAALEAIQHYSPDDRLIETPLSVCRALLSEQNIYLNSIESVSPGQFTEKIFG